VSADFRAAPIPVAAVVRVSAPEKTVVVSPPRLSAKVVLGSDPLSSAPALVVESWMTTSEISTLLLKKTLGAAPG
jgi:hypothetical protein